MSNKESLAQLAKNVALVTRRYWTVLQANATGRVDRRQAPWHSTYTFADGSKLHDYGNRDMRIVK